MLRVHLIETRIHVADPCCVVHVLGEIVVWVRVAAKHVTRQRSRQVSARGDGGQRLGFQAQSGEPGASAW